MARNRTTDYSAEELESMRVSKQMNDINELEGMIQAYAEKTNSRDYKVLDEERQIFSRIVVMINNIDKYL